jgi:phage tail-like protein
MIDANKQRSWLLGAAAAFQLDAVYEQLEWNTKLQVLRLRSSRRIDSLPNDRAAAAALADQRPMTLDAFGTWAGVNPAGDAIIAGGAMGDPVTPLPIPVGDPLLAGEIMADTVDILPIPAGETLVDMAMNTDGVLYAVSRDAAGVSTIYLINRLGSKEEHKVEVEGYDAGLFDTEAVKTLQTGSAVQPDRVAALAQGGALLLDRESGLFYQIFGEPCRDQPRGIYRPETPRPCHDFAPPQTLIPRPDLNLPAGSTAVAMASNPGGVVAVLLFPAAEEDPAEVILISEDKISASLPLADTGAPFSIGWVEGDLWAVLFEDLKEAVVYSLPFLEERPARPLTPVGYRYPLNWGTGGAFKNHPFFNGLSAPVFYRSTDRHGHFKPRPLHHLSFPAYPLNATVDAAKPIDSQRPGTVWHRAYLEAHLPEGTGVKVSLAAADELSELDHPRWMEHQFGGVEPKPEVPRGVWLKAASEVPFHKGLLHCRPVRNRSGLFTVLIQKPGYAVRSLKGRYLKVRLEMLGNGHESPEIAALRIYGPRFSYLDQYLPELYRETLTGENANAKGPATGSDFLQRFLSLFESFLTPLEDKVGAAHMVTNPMSAPADALDWLSGWVAMNLEPGLAEEKKRRYIEAATRFYPRRGTIRGLALALDMATDDWVKKGDIVLLEDFRLRRTFATILGADLTIEDDPLLMGKIPSANSYVGDTLILGEESKKEFLALYSDDFEKTGDEQEIIDNFYARLANRLTVLVHQHTSEEALALIRRIVSHEIPAHIEFRIVTASKPLLIGLYSLVGVDTYLQEEPPRNVARAGRSYLGRYDFIKKLPTLDDRLEP